MRDWVRSAWALARRKRPMAALLLAVLMVLPAAGFAEDAEKEAGEKEPAAILEFSGVVGWSLPDGTVSAGPGIAVEFTPIEHWLEIETGTAAVFRHHTTEWDTDILFKKPWTLSDKVEFMAGAGPEWVAVRQEGATVNSVAAEVVADFMFWPTAKRRFGWYVEPGYEYDFAQHEHGLGFSTGLLIAIP